MQTPHFVLVAVLFVTLLVPLGSVAQEGAEAGPELEWVSQRSVALMENFTHQSTDDAWSKLAEGVLGELFREAKVAVSKLECRETLCLVVAGSVVVERWDDHISPLLGEFGTLEGHASFSTFLVLNAATGEYSVFFTRGGYLITGDHLVVSESTYRNSFPDLVE